MPLENAKCRPPTLRQAERELTQRFAASHSDTPALDARLLIEAATGIDRMAWVREPDQVINDDAAARLAKYAERRMSHEPVSRILGRRSFYGREFEITPATLDPRPDSETLIRLALELTAAEEIAHRPIRILDIGTGSGCLLVTLLAELPGATGVGTDIDLGALAVARRNGLRHAIDSRVDWRVARSLKAVDETFDLIVANPPYIPSGNINSLAPEVRDFDPRVALDGGADGLEIYREIIADLSPNRVSGWLIFEVGYDQSAAVAALMQQASTLDMATFRVAVDLNAHQRCVACRAHPPDRCEK